MKVTERETENENNKAERKRKKVRFVPIMFYYKDFLEFETA